MSQVVTKVVLEDVLGKHRCACCAGPVVLAGSLYRSVRGAEDGLEKLQDTTKRADTHDLRSLREACRQEWGL